MENNFLILIFFMSYLSLNLTLKDELNKFKKDYILILQSFISMSLENHLNNQFKNHNRNDHHEFQNARLFGGNNVSFF